MAAKAKTKSIFEQFSSAVSAWAGKPATFIAAVIFIVVWAVTGPLFGFSETWQLVVNTGTTIITFLMVFVLQNSQNRSGEAMQAKLDELILSSHAANNFIGIEDMDEHELKDLSESLRKHADRLRHRADGISAGKDGGRTD
ncbi:low affinity iron permease family protein [Neorhizobium sp. NCHU2750]|uniref:low affinity iron permease family protein n=1 Tax=Neorhizobium sp. NCHU2750 TaxID=1825976 RepID=UPI000E75FA2D|nr:hypothetical protein NCHU2750_23210 [Neorhizobium sp. NCHU2750]